VSGRRPFFAWTGFSAHRVGRPVIYVARRVLRRIISRRYGIGTILECSRDPRKCLSIPLPFSHFPSRSLLHYSDAAFRNGSRNTEIPSSARGCRKAASKKQTGGAEEIEEREYAEIFNDVRGGGCGGISFRSSERGSYPLIQTRAMDDALRMDRL